MEEVGGGLHVWQSMAGVVKQHCSRVLQLDLYVFAFRSLNIIRRLIPAVGQGHAIERSALGRCSIMAEPRQ